MKSHDLMAEEELLQLHCTQSKEMNGCSALKQHDNVHRQITAFEKLLQHAINRFSTEKLYHMLKQLMKSVPLLPSDPDPPGGQHGGDDAKISSLRELRTTTASLHDSGKRRGIEKDEERHLAKYFDIFFDDIGYLKDLKKNFDQKIYVCLYEYFYDPADDTFNPREVIKRVKTRQVSFRRDEGHANEGRDEIQGDNIPLRSQDDGTHFDERELDFYFDKLDDQEKLSMAVRKMYQWNEKWDTLFIEDKLDPEIFDPDSKHEILPYANCEDFVTLLRLVPDIFVKSYKSVELAKLWWTQANKVYGGRVSGTKRPSPSKQYPVEVVKLEKKISGLKQDITHNMDLLSRHKRELKHISHRESRYKQLSEQCETVEERKNAVGQRYNEMLLEREALKQELKLIQNGSRKHDATIEALRVCSKQLLESFTQLRTLTFQFKLIEEDFSIELQVRPDIIRFVADLQEKVEALNLSITRKRKDKLHAEKRLVLLMTNCERMRQIMQKYKDGESNPLLSDSAGFGVKQQRRKKERTLHTIDASQNGYSQSRVRQNDRKDQSLPVQAPKTQDKATIHRRKATEPSMIPKRIVPDQSQGRRRDAKSDDVASRRNKKAHGHRGKETHSSLDSESEADDGNDADTESPPASIRTHGAANGTTRFNHSQPLYPGQYSDRGS